MELAAKTVPESQGCVSGVEPFFEAESTRPELLPALAGLQLVVESRNVTPGVDGIALISQPFQEASVADLGIGGEITATNEVHEASDGVLWPQTPALTASLPTGHPAARVRTTASASFTWAGPSRRLLKTS